MSDPIYKNGFYTTQDLVDILESIRQKREYYKRNKHTMDLLEVINAREELAIHNSELGDIGADLLIDKMDTELQQRMTFLELKEKYEEEFRTTKRPDGSKWTDVENRARYKAEMETRELQETADKARAIYVRAFNLYAKSIPEVLNAMSGRIAFLLKLMQAQAAPAQPIENGALLPSGRKYAAQDDGFSEFSTTYRTAAGDPGEVDDDLEALSQLKLD